jgi:hypothetical protein
MGWVFTLSLGPFLSQLTTPWPAPIQDIQQPGTCHCYITSPLAHHNSTRMSNANTSADDNNNQQVGMTITTWAASAQYQA